MNLYVWGISAFAAFGGFMFGYDIGWVDIILQQHVDLYLWLILSMWLVDTIAMDKKRTHLAKAVVSN